MTATTLPAVVEADADEPSVFDELVPLYGKCLEAITRGCTVNDRADALCRLFQAALPRLLTYYSDILADYYDLVRAVKVSLPCVLCNGIRGFVRSQVVRDLDYPLHARRYLLRAVALVEWRIDPAGQFARTYWNAERLLGVRLNGHTRKPAFPQDPLEINLLADLQAVVRDFGRSVLMGQPLRTLSVEERAALRHRKAERYIAVWGLQGMLVTFADICRMLHIRQTGRGSWRDWFNGKLRDSNPTTRKIEDFLAACEPPTEYKLIEVYAEESENLMPIGIKPKADAETEK